jgi:hypothetical protein
MTLFCSEFMECLPGISSRYFLRPLVTVPVAPMTVGITEHFMFHFRWISTHIFLFIIIIIFIFIASNHISYKPTALTATVVKQPQTAADSTEPLKHASNTA